MQAAVTAATKAEATRIATVPAPTNKTLVLTIAVSAPPG